MLVVSTNAKASHFEAANDSGIIIAIILRYTIAPCVTKSLRL